MNLASVFPRMPASGVLLSAALLCSTASSAFAQAPPNDDCSSPLPIAGTGLFGWDLTDATTGGPQSFGNCVTGGAAAGFANDVWFCWTATCTGLVELSTCGLTQVDTRIAIYPLSCACPEDSVLPLCCNDNACEKQSQLTCEVVCCERYLIRVGAAPGSVMGPGQLSIDCFGDPCDPCDGTEPVACDDCCGARPSFTGFSGAVAIATQHRYTAAEPVVRAFDVSGPGLNAPGTLSTPPAYTHPSWTLANLGTVFGVTLDDVGHVHVTHSTAYFQDQVGSGGAGAIYRLDAATGAASTFATLPNNAIAGCSGTECFPGLGNISFDCERRTFYVSNFEDGRIYRLDAVGNVLGTFDHATGAIAAGGAPEPGDANGFAPLGERVWAVQPSGGRLYYSTWAEDGGRPDATLANEIWSIALDGSGQFVGAAQLEFAMPGFQGQDWSNPVSDITFDGECCMTVAERSMADDTTPSAHNSRVLEFCFDPITGWLPSVATWDIGDPGLPTSSAGGVAIDFAPGGLLWASADAIQFSPDVIYGLQGAPQTGGDVPSSLLIDLDAEVTQQDKTQIGDVEVSCPLECAVITESEIDCIIGPDGPTGDYTWTFTLTNNSGTAAQYLLFPSGNVTPNVVVFAPPLPHLSSTTISVTLTGLDPTVTPCVDLILADTQFQECCSIRHCFELPDCDCAVVDLVKTFCVPGGSGAFQIWMNVTPLDFVAEHLFVLAPLPPDPNSGIGINPVWNDISIPQFGTGFVGPITITGAIPGSTLCLTIAVHDATLQLCCMEELCFEVPNCPSGVICTGDLNGDGIVDGADFGMLLGSWGPTGGAAVPADLNEDGVVDGNDLGLMLGAWGACG